MRRLAGVLLCGAVLLAVQVAVVANESEEILELSVTKPEHRGAGEDMAALEPMRVSMEFQDANLKDILKVFSEQTGVNVIAGADVGDVPVTLYLEDVTVMDALDQILRASSLTYERPPGSEIYIVRSKGPEATATVTRVYRLKYARVSQSVLAKAAAAFAALTPFEAHIGTGTTSDGAARGGGGGGASAPPAFGGGGGAGTAEVGIDSVIKTLLTPQGSVVVDGRTNSLIVTDVPENFPRLEAALAALDIRTPQILVAAEIIETSLSKIKDLGIEWGTGSEGTLFQLTPAKRSTRFPFSSGILRKNAAPLGSEASITVGSFDSSQAIAALQALESDSDTKILARPKVLTLDNESALIRLTTDQAVGFTTNNQTDTGSVTSAPERATTGVVLVVTPQVNQDGYITMLVEPSVTKTVASKISAPSGQSTPIDPKTRSSRTMVRIRSGDTLVVAGLIDRSDQTTVTKVPILGDIPIVGEAFKNTEVSDSASELIVFVTPRLLEEATAAQIASADQAVGLREQEPVGERQQAIEQTLSQLEQ